MKRALFLGSIAAMCLFSSCKSDPCETVNCENGGTCVDGTCNCPTGYSGVICQIAPVIDPCANVTCVNGTATASGTTCDCVCEEGYEGAACDIESRAKFLVTGQSVIEHCGSLTSTPYIIDVIAGTDVTEVKIKNLANYNCSGGQDYYVSGTIEDNAISIPTQVVSVCGVTFTGSGSVTGSTVTISYSATDGALITDNCTITYTK
jgi:hypothetical protein